MDGTLDADFEGVFQDTLERCESGAAADQDIGPQPRANGDVRPDARILAFERTWNIAPADTACRAEYPE